MSISNRNLLLACMFFSLHCACYLASCIVHVSLSGANVFFTVLEFPFLFFPHGEALPRLLTILLLHSCTYARRSVACLYIEFRESFWPPRSEA